MNAVATTATDEAALTTAMKFVQRGWTQDAYCRTKSGAACMPDGSEGEIRRVDLAWAVEYAAREHGLDGDRLRGLVQAQLPEPHRSSVFGLESWNDQLWRTRTEVILLLERTIQALSV